MEIVIRASVMIVLLWAVTRAVGRSTLGELSTFELLLYVTMGDLVQQSVTQQDYSVTSGVLTISLFAPMTVALSGLQWKFPPDPVYHPRWSMTSAVQTASSEPRPMNSCLSLSSTTGCEEAGLGHQRTGGGRPA